MGVKEYHRVQPPIVDYRKSGKSYYTAVCDCCGRTFYPQKAHAKYCCGPCNQEAFNKQRKATGGRVATGKAKAKKTKPKPAPKLAAAVEKPGYYAPMDADGVEEFLTVYELDCKGYAHALRTLKIGGKNTHFKRFTVTRLTESDYSVQDLETA